MERTLDAGLTVDANVHDDSIDVNIQGEGRPKDKSVNADENHIKIPLLAARDVRPA